MTTSHRVSSFDYKITNKTIRDALKQRSLLDNTIQVGMPFVRATTTLQQPEYLGAGNIGFSIGLHSIDEDVQYQDIYSSTGAGTTYPLVGYTFKPDGTPERVYATPPSSEVTAINALFDQGKDLYTSDGSFSRVPPPGITRMTVGRNKNGLLAVGDLEISVPTLSQLEILHRTFLVPGVGMILEWGQKFAEGGGILNLLTREHMFPWSNRTELENILARLAQRTLGLEEILEKSVYPTNGQYMWMFGRVANFSTKANADGSFTCSVRVVGPSEDSWAYSTTVTVIPPPDNSGNICLDKTNSIESYFKETANSPGLNFKTLLDGVLNAGDEDELVGWKDHIVKIKNGNKQEGEPPGDKDADEPNVSLTNFADNDDAYFITWRFFVNVVLNHPAHGIPNIFKKAGLTDEELKKINTLRPYKNTSDSIINLDTPGDKILSDSLEPYVGYNDYLRSSDPSTLIINNERAENLTKASELAEKYKPLLKQDKDSFLGLFNRKSKEQVKVAYGDFRSAGEFGETDIITETTEQFPQTPTITQPANTTPTSPKGTKPEDQDKGLLSTGIWLNHRAIIESMLSGDTLLRGVTNLLERMNAATTNYWKLTLDALEAMEGEQYQYIVADANYRNNSQAAQALLQDIHVFNKYVRKLGDTLYGSEIIDCTVDLSLPKRLFAQIATLGLIKPGDLERAGVEVGETTERYKCKNSLISDANETLREMFAITSISNNGQNSPDLTIRWGTPVESTSGTGICRNQANLTTAQADGSTLSRTGGSSTPIQTVEDAADLVENAQDKVNRLTELTSVDGISNQSICPPPVENISTNGGYGPSSLAFLTNPNNVWSAAFISYVMQAAGVPFQSSAAHTDYAQRLRNGFGGWQALNPATTRLQVGDVVVANRSNSTNVFTSQTYSGKGHGDIVTAVSDNSATLTGGNVSQRVGITPKNLSNGVLTDVATAGNQLNKYFVVLRPPSGKANTILNTTTAEFQKWSSGGWRELSPSAYESMRSYYEAGGFDVTNFKPPLPPANTPPTPPTPGSNANDETYKKIGNNVYLDNVTGAAANPGGGFIPFPSDAQLIQDGISKCQELERAKQELEQANKIKTESETATATIDRVLRKFNGLSVVFNYIELFPELMVAQIRCDADGNKSNAFGAAPGALSLSADLVLPGINGMRVGELFWIDRIPSFYKAFGAFQILSIEDQITNDGWTTRIHSRFNYLGNAWKTSVVELLQTAKNNANNSVIPDVGQPIT